MRKFLYFGRYMPELFSDFGIYMQSLNEKNVKWKTLISKLASFPNWLHISSPPHSFRGHTSKRLACCAHRTTDCCVVAVRYRISRLNTFLCSSVRCFRGGAFPTQHHYTQCPCRFFILERYNLFCGHRLSE